MAAGDKYFTCENTDESLRQVLGRMIVEDANGNPKWAHTPLTFSLLLAVNSSQLDTDFNKVWYNKTADVLHVNDESQHGEIYVPNRPELVGDTITITPPTDYQIYNPNDSTWHSTAFSFIIGPGDGSNPLALFKYRLKQGVAVASYNQNITVTSADPLVTGPLVIPITGQSITVSANWSAWHTALSGTKPSGHLTHGLNDLIDGNVADGNATHMDYYLRTGGMETDEQRLKPFINLGAVADATPIGSPVLDSNGLHTLTGKYLESNWIPTTNAVKYSQNNASMGCYIISGVPTSGTPSIMGVNGGGNGHRAQMFVIGQTSVGVRNNCNSSAANSFTFTNTGAGGFYSVKRTGSTTGTIRKDLATSTAALNASTGISNQEFQLGAASNSALNGGVFTMFFMGNSSIDMALLRTRERNFLTEMGLTLPN